MQVLVRMNKGNYIVRTRRARRCRADGERCALDFNLATSFSFSFFFSKKLGARLSLYPFPPSPASPAAAASPPTLASSWEYICMYMCVYM